MISPVVVLFICIVLTLSAVPFLKWFVRRQQFIRAIDALPGPKAYPIIGSAYICFGLDRIGLNKLFENLNAKYPVIIREWLGPMAQVRLKKAAHLETVLMSSKAHLEKSWSYVFAKPWLGEGLLLSHGAKWFGRRKMLTPAFHFSILEGFCEIMVDKSNVLVEKLRPKAESGESFQIYPFIKRAALDIITEAAMGTVINAQDDVDNKYVAAVYEATELVIRRMLMPWMHSDFVYKHTSEGKRFAEHLRILHGFTKDVIASRMALRTEYQQKKLSVHHNSTRKRHPAFLDLLLDANDASSSQLTVDDIREEVDTFMFEGHDTTAAGISWALYLLGRHPKIQEEVFAEMQSIFGNTGRNAVIKDLNDMHLLDRVIKETLRIYPAVPLIGRKVSEPIKLDDEYSLPEGCNIVVDIALLHRDPNYFPDPLRFDPDRFLPENLEGRHSMAYIPFSFGSRNCIGKKFAIYEEKVVLSTIVRNYRFWSVGNEEVPLKELTTKPRYLVNLVLEKR